MLEVLHQLGRVTLIVVIAAIVLAWAWIVPIARHVRADDGTVRVDNDDDVGCAASVSALADVGGHDGRDDAAVGDAAAGSGRPK